MSDLLALLESSNLQLVPEAFVGRCRMCADNNESRVVRLQKFPFVLPVLVDKSKRDNLWPFYFVCARCKQLSKYTEEDISKGDTGTIYELMQRSPANRDAARKVQREYERLGPQLDAQWLWQLETEHKIELGPVHTIAPSDSLKSRFKSLVTVALGIPCEIKSMDRCFQYAFNGPSFLYDPENPKPLFVSPH